MPESAAPKLGKVSSLVSMEVDVPAGANGVLYALAGFSGGLTCYMRDGELCYEFNLFEIERTKIRSSGKLRAGKAKIEVVTKLVDKIGGPLDVTLKVNGQEVGKGPVPRAMSLDFNMLTHQDVETALTTFDPIWESMTLRDQIRLIQVVVKQVDYDGETGRVTITFHPLGVKRCAPHATRDLAEAHA